MADETNTTERIQRVAHLVELTAREAGFPAVTPEFPGYHVFAGPEVGGRIYTVGVQDDTQYREVIVHVRHPVLAAAGLAVLNALTCLTGPRAPEHPIGERVKRAQARAEELAEYLRA